MSKRINSKQQPNPSPKQTAFFAPSPGQGQLVVGPADDRYEREADAMAEKISGASPTIQRSGSGSSQPVDPAVEASIRSAGSGAPLPNAIQREMEGQFSADFSGVRVHQGAESERLNDSLSANAFTHGNDIFFNRNQYAPNTSSGKRILAHELTHTIQQGKSPQLGIQRDLAVAPTTPGRTVPTLTEAQINRAITYNQGKHTDPVEIALMRDILGLGGTPPVFDADFIHALVQYQTEYGLSRDGRLGPATAAQLAREIIAEADFLGAGNLGSLGPEFSVQTALQNLINADNRTYGDYKAAIQGSTMIRRQIALHNQALLRGIKSKLSWSNWARCIELLGRRAPTHNQLVGMPAIRAALRAAWTASNPAVNPPRTTQHEEGGWVFMNLITGGFTVRRQAAGAGASINLASPPTVANSIVVAKFHTHPNLGPSWVHTASPADTTVDARHGVPDIIVASTDLDATTFVFFSSGPTRRRHLGGNRGLPGSGGGTAPQAKADGTHDDQ